MGAISKRTSASLRISSEVRSASEITRMMGSASTSSYEKGDRVSLRSPKPTFRQNSMWIRDSGLPTGDSMDNHVAAICRFMESHQQELRELRSNCDVDIFCGLFSDTGQAGFALSKETIKKVAALDVDLVLDVYAGE